ncbi:MAG: tryptophan 7-halogenase [Gemmatimonadota bacterium]|nr:tryptophan 7-halogenase [Gemmatimonadota bacterium]
MSGSERTSFEVIVLGGGPAGTAAATLLARRSHEVVLVRPASPPAAKLAQSIPPSARLLLSELGVLEAIEAAGFHPNTGNKVWWADGDARGERFRANEPGFHVDRVGLERIMVAAAESIGARVLLGMSAREAVQTGEGFRVTCEGVDGGTLELRAPWLIDATGRHGLLARQVREPDRSTTTLALVGRFHRPGGWGDDTSGHTLIESYLDGWAWSVPLSPESRCVTAMIDQRHAELSGADVDAMLAGELAKTHRLGTLLDGATPEGAAWACPASLYCASQYARPGLALAGDAGSFIDPLSSYGVKKALASGWLAAVATHTALIDPSMTDVAVSFFDAREREVYRGYRRRSAEFFEEAAEAYQHPYWQTRAEAARAAGGTDFSARDGGNKQDPDRLEALEGSPVSEQAVRAAFEQIRSRESLSAATGSSVRTIRRPAIASHRIVLEQHLATDRYPKGLRYARSVDLRRLSELALEHDEVPDLWSAYNGVAPPVPLPDFLTALATAFAAGLLEHRER